MYSEEEIKRAKRIWMRILIPAITVSTPGLVYYFLYPESTLGFVMALTYAFIWNDIFLSLFDPRFKDRKYRDRSCGSFGAWEPLKVALVPAGG